MSPAIDAQARLRDILTNLSRLPQNKKKPQKKGSSPPSNVLSAPSTSLEQPLSVVEELTVAINTSGPTMVMDGSIMEGLSIGTGLEDDNDDESVQGSDKGVACSSNEGSKLLIGDSRESKMKAIGKAIVRY